MPGSSRFRGFIWRERLRKALWGLAAAAIVAGLLVAIYLVQAPGDTQAVAGVVTGIHGQPTEEGERRYLLVQLDSGRGVQARISAAVPLRRGERVLVTETRSRFGNARRYRFLRYVEE